MPQYRETPRESEMLRLLAQGRIDISPLKIVSMDREVARKARPKDYRPDAELVLRWQKKTYRFVVECKAISTPKEITFAAEAAKRSSNPPRSYPLVVTPYLPETQLAQLEEQQVSGIDLSGNILVLVPGEILVSRKGAPNKFPRSGVIKNVYRKNSSIVARAFLLTPQFGSLSQIMDEIKARGGTVTQATVSKVCGSLDQDLVIERATGKTPRTRTLRLIQPEKLLELVTTNYATPVISQRLSAKVSLSPEEFRRGLAEWGRQTGEKAVLTGASSAVEYAVTTPEAVQSFYCSNVESLRKQFLTELDDTSRFPTVELLETDDDFVYFDARENLVASPVQAYLELMRGDKRQQETAEQVRNAILQRLKTKG